MAVADVPSVGFEPALFEFMPAACDALGPTWRLRCVSHAAPKVVAALTDGVLCEPARVTEIRRGLRLGAADIFRLVHVVAGLTPLTAYLDGHTALDWTTLVRGDVGIGLRHLVGCPRSPARRSTFAALLVEHGEVVGREQTGVRNAGFVAGDGRRRRQWDRTNAVATPRIPLSARHAPRCVGLRYRAALATALTSAGPDASSRRRGRGRFSRRFTYFRTRRDARVLARVSRSNPERSSGRRTGGDRSACANASDATRDGCVSDAC